MTGTEHRSHTVSGVPVTRVLDELRAATAAITEELTDPRAGTAARKLDRALVRWISLEAHQSEVAAEFLPDRAALAASAVEVLGRSAGPGGLTSPADLAGLVHALIDETPAPFPVAVRALLRDIAANDLAERQAFEQMTEKVRRGGTGGARRHPDIDAPSWERYLRRKSPTRPARRVRSLRELVGGVSKRTFRVELEPPGNADDPRLPDTMVIRMDTGNFATTVVAEHPLLERLSRAGAPVPEPLWLEADTEPFGHPFLVTRCLQGFAPATLFDVRGASRHAALALAEALAAVHAIPIGTLVDDPPDAARQPVAALLDDVERQWRNAMPVPSVPMEIGFAALREQLHHVDGPAALVHGDCGVQNILLDDGRLSGLLDWEFAHVGDPAEDLAYCRPAVEQLVPWDDFVTHYRRCGGPVVSQERLGFFDVWCQLRNCALAAGVLHDYAGGRVSGVNMLVTAIDTYARVEVQLAERVHRFMSGEPSRLGAVG